MFTSVCFQSFLFAYVVVHNGLVDRVLTFAVKLCGVFMRVCWAGRDRFVL